MDFKDCNDSWHRKYQSCCCYFILASHVHFCDVDWGFGIGSSWWACTRASFTTVCRGKKCHQESNVLLLHLAFRKLFLCKLSYDECVCPTFQTVEEACTNLLPNVLCEYLYNLSEYFTKFYSNCQVQSNYAKILVLSFFFIFPFFFPLWIDNNIKTKMFTT